MGLRDRLGLTARTTVPDSITTLDLRPPEAQRISRPVSYVGAQAATRAPSSLTRAAEEGYGGSALVYRCVQAIATNAASLDLVVERTLRDGTLEPQALHPISLLWNRRPNPMLSARILKEVVWSQLELAGEAFLYVDRGPTGLADPIGVWPIYDPVDVVVDRSMAGELQGYLVKVGSKKVPLLPSEVLWLRYPHPSQAWGSISPLRAATFSVELDAWAKAWQLGELKNGARPEGVVYLGDLDPEDHDTAVAAFEARHQGPGNAARHLFVSGPTKADYTRIGLTAAEVSYLDSRRVNAEDIALAYGVPMDLLRGGSTYENQRAAKVNLWTDTLVPKLEVVAGEVDRQLLPDLDLSARFDTSQVDALQENQDAIVSRLQALSYVDAITVDEVRAGAGLEPLPDDRGSYTLTAFRQAELNRVALEQPAPLDAVALEEAVDDAAADDAPADDDPAEPGDVEARVQTRGRRVEPLTYDEVQRHYDRLEAVVERAVKRLADKQRRVVKRKLKGVTLAAAHDLATRAAAPDAALEVEVRAQVSDLFDVPYWIEQTRELLAPAVAAAWDAGATATASALGLSFDLLDLNVLLAMEGRVDVLVDEVTETTRKTMQDQLLLPGVAAGESQDELAARILSVFDGLAGHRARTIARTETVGGFNHASRIAATESGQVQAREWLATRDDRTRDTHRDLDGHKTNGLDDPYPNGVLFPGDPSGRADETINCRCTELFILRDTPPAPQPAMNVGE